MSPEFIFMTEVRITRYQKLGIAINLLLTPTGRQPQAEIAINFRLGLFQPGNRKSPGQAAQRERDSGRISFMPNCADAAHIPLSTCCQLLNIKVHHNRADQSRCLRWCCFQQSARKVSFSNSS